MSYVGNTSTTQAFTPAIDYFSGNGSTVAFTLSRPVASVAQVQVVVNNVAQNPTDAFTVLNNTITFTSAPSSGTNNIYVQYTSPITQVMQPGQGTVGAVQLVAGAVGTAAIADGAVTTAKIADSAITTAKIAAGAVATVDIADGAVTTAKIADLNVTTAKIADLNVTTAKIADSNVTTAKIADANVTIAKLSATGTPSSSNYLRGDGSWQTVSTTPTTAQVLSATAGASVGEVGTYAFLSIPTTLTTSFTQGSTYAGSSLRYSGGQSAGGLRPNISGTAPAGTWRAMGIGGYRSGCCTTAFYATLFLRIS